MTNIKIKPLEFEKWDETFQVARAFGYDYEIMLMDRDAEYWMCVSHCGNGFYNLRCKTLESAIAAANAQFQVSFADWLEITP